MVCLGVSAISEEDALQWPQAQGKCETVLPEMAGGASTETGGRHK